jgi:hypothetical protein
MPTRAPILKAARMFRNNLDRRAALIGLLVLFWPTIGTAQEALMKFRVVPGQSCGGSCASEIAADGMITPESAEDFRKIANTLRPNQILVRLASPGGSLVGSLQLGQAFREFNSTVIVGKGARCASACLYAFLGGATRRVAGGQIGVHRFRPESEETDQDFPTVLVQRATEVLTSYVTQMGADPDLIKLAMTIVPPSIYYLNAGEMRRFHVTN